jgi:tetratricopeptide (TPR) repeat protein
VLIFLNEGNGTKGPDIYKMRSDFTNALYRQPLAPPKPSLHDLLAAEIPHRGAHAALSNVNALLARSAKPDDGNCLNTLAYQYAEAGQPATAISILQLAAHLFPQEGNLYDSMGELYLAQGDKEKTIAAYQRAVELDPKNTSAAEVLDKLSAALVSRQHKP